MQLADLEPPLFQRGFITAYDILGAKVKVKCGEIM
jgi:hypothetical protein